MSTTTPLSVEKFINGVNDKNKTYLIIATVFVLLFITQIGTHVNTYKALNNNMKNAKLKKVCLGTTIVLSITTLLFIIYCFTSKIQNERNINLILFLSTLVYLVSSGLCIYSGYELHTYKNNGESVKESAVRVNIIVGIISIILLFSYSIVNGYESARDTRETTDESV